MRRRWIGVLLGAAMVLGGLAGCGDEGGVASGVGGAVSAGGTPTGGDGVGTGGVGTPTGGVPASGGESGESGAVTAGTGGDVGAGGAATGGFGWPTGGSADTGGTATGGSADTGGLATAGTAGSQASTGGDATGGFGWPTGGNEDTGGAPSGGTGTGGDATGGSTAGSGGSTSDDPFAQARIDCVARINAFRATEGLPPYEQWVDAEACTDEQAAADSTEGAHANFGDCDEWAQNTCPGWRDVDQVIEGCLQSMWDEGPGEPFSEHGHYINMSSTEYTQVACGFYVMPNGEIWANQNFR